MLTAVEIAASVRRGESTARSHVEAALARIAERDGRIGAFQVVRERAALEEADAVDADPDRAGLPLAGVPIAIKDNVEVTGEPMRVGTAASDPTPQTKDHEIVRRLRQAGAVVVGLTAVPELCIFGATDSTFGITRNPWNLDRTTGGSSGGAAAAVAAGMVAVAHGNDGMGSVRIPSACCGLVGIKPGKGVVPSDLGNGAWFGMAENGALATTVADAALVFSVLAARPDYASLADPGSLRIAVSTRVPMPLTPLDKHWRDAVRSTAELLRKAGHSVRDRDPSYGLTLAPTEIARWTAGSELDAQLMADRSALEKRTKVHTAIGRGVLKLGLPKESGRQRWIYRAEKFFDDIDVLVTPALAQPPKRSIAWGQKSWLANILSDARHSPFAAPWNLAGWPAMAVPAGQAPDGQPVVVQLVGRPGSEKRLLELAAQIEQLHPWRRTAPL